MYADLTREHLNSLGRILFYYNQNMQGIPFVPANLDALRATNPTIVATRATLESIQRLTEQVSAGQDRVSRTQAVSMASHLDSLNRAIPHLSGFRDKVASLCLTLSTLTRAISSSGVSVNSILTEQEAGSNFATLSHYTPRLEGLPPCVERLMNFLNIYANPAPATPPLSGKPAAWFAQVLDGLTINFVVVPQPIRLSPHLTEGHRSRILDQNPTFDPGPVLIEQDLDRIFGMPNGMAVYPMRPLFSSRNNSYWHPHVSGTALCLGHSAPDMIDECLKELDMGTIANVLRNLLSTYNPQSPFCPISYFVNIPGREMRPADVLDLGILSFNTYERQANNYFSNMRQSVAGHNFQLRTDSPLSFRPPLPPPPPPPPLSLPELQTGPHNDRVSLEEISSWFPISSLWDPQPEPVETHPSVFVVAPTDPATHQNPNPPTEQPTPPTPVPLRLGVIRLPRGALDNLEVVRPRTTVRSINDEAMNEVMGTPMHSNPRPIT